MKLEIDTFSKFIVIGDRVLIRPKNASSKTNSGLYLPPGVHENEKIHSGYVIKSGPGYPISSGEEEESWKSSQIKYIPLQAREGDLAIYLQKQAYEIEFNKEKYVIVPHSAILLLMREEDLFE